MGELDALSAPGSRNSADVRLRFSLECHSFARILSFRPGVGIGFIPEGFQFSTFLADNWGLRIYFRCDVLHHFFLVCAPLALEGFWDHFLFQMSDCCFVSDLLAEKALPDVHSGGRVASLLAPLVSLPHFVGHGACL